MMSNKKNDLFHRLEELPSRLYVTLAILAIAVHVLICTYTNISVAACGFTLLSIYLVVALGVYFFTHRQLSRFRFESDVSDQQSNSVIYAFRNSLTIPYAVVTESGKVLTVNAAMRAVADLPDSVLNLDIAQICQHTMEQIMSMTQQPSEEEAHPEHDFVPDPALHVGHTKNMVSVGEKKYRLECHPLPSKGKLYYILVFHDITELDEVSTLYHNNLTAIAYIVLDNLEEIAQYVKVSYQTEARQVETLLKDWADSMGGVLREYDRNKYILLLSREMVASCIKNKFEILDEVRKIRIGEDNMPITISMGIATTGDTVAKRERDALVALDMALQRGGDQVVLKNDLGNHFFGGRTKSQQKRTRGHSRIIAGKLCNMISGSPNVLVMGHSNPDFDSIGACVGIAALCLHLGVDVKIIADTKSENFKACTSRLIELADYKNMFVDGVAGLDESSFGTLLIVVDANNFSILEAPEIANNSFKTAVIDHHIKKTEFEHEPQLSYIDPSASSASELISEILEQSLPVGTLRKEEANLLMAGIMVDTQNFTRTVGTRTFAAALYLRSAGASPEYARTFFEEAFEDYLAEAQFGSEAHIYRDEIAITSIEGSGAAGDRVAAAKAADKLLSVRHVNASFALIRIGNTVYISARSNGGINVQLILEKLGGGGHFDVAGAALVDSSLREAEKLLIDAIDTYFEDLD